jgi:hypothetical protein
MKLAELKTKLQKRFPNDKDKSDKALIKERRSYRIIEVIWLVYAVLMAAILGLIPAGIETTLRVAGVAACAAGMALSLALYAQFRVLEVECGFELRLREALKNAKAF